MPRGGPDRQRRAKFWAQRDNSCCCVAAERLNLYWLRARVFVGTPDKAVTGGAPLEAEHDAVCRGS